MIKFTATGNDGRKHLFLGLSFKNLELLRQDKPIKIIAEEVGISHDVMIFAGETEQAMVDMLIAGGIKLPEPENIHTHHDDDRQEGGEH